MISYIPASGIVLGLPYQLYILEEAVLEPNFIWCGMLTQQDSRLGVYTFKTPQLPDTAPFRTLPDSYGKTWALRYISRKRNEV